MKRLTALFLALALAALCLAGALADAGGMKGKTWPDFGFRLEQGLKARTVQHDGASRRKRRPGGRRFLRFFVLLLQHLFFRFVNFGALPKSFLYA